MIQNFTCTYQIYSIKNFKSKYFELPALSLKPNKPHNFCNTCQNDTKQSLTCRTWWIEELFKTSMQNFINIEPLELAHTYKSPKLAP